MPDRRTSRSGRDQAARSRSRFVTLALTLPHLLMYLGFVSLGAWAIYILAHELGLVPHEGRTPVQRAKSDMRTLATAIEWYFADQGVYPVHTTNTAMSAFAGRRKLAGIPTFRMRTSRGELASLTSPVAYVPALFEDPMAPGRDATYGYFTDGKGWIMFSPGPDGDYDGCWRFYDSSIDGPSPGLLIGATYDPTNGWVSDGDVWRVKE